MRQLGLSYTPGCPKIQPLYYTYLEESYHFEAVMASCFWIKLRIRRLQPRPAPTYFKACQNFCNDKDFIYKIVEDIFLLILIYLSG
jgi:hypothetical protein